MTKGQFIIFMEELEVRRHDYLEWIDGIEDVLGGAWEPIMEHSFGPFLIDTIRTILHDEDDWLSYFLYEKEGNWFSYYRFDDKEIKIDNYEKLYDLITKGWVE